MDWYLVPSLSALRAEANRLFPNRDKSSDGSIGDAAHSSRTSDHNPDPITGAVRAYDLDEDIDGTDDVSGTELMFFAEAIRSRRDPRIKYVIYEGRMFASYSTSTRKAWEWGPYSGTTNPHTRHMHISVLSSNVGENDTSPWFPVSDSEQEDDMPLSQDDLWKVKETVKTAMREAINDPADPFRKAFGDSFAYWCSEDEAWIKSVQDAVRPVVAEQLSQVVVQVTGELVEDAVRKVFADAGQE